MGHTGIDIIDGGPFVNGTLYDFKISTDKPKLVVIYAEEGHPSLVYYDISEWNMNNEPETIWGLDTYPGSIGHDGWDGKDLIVESDHDLLLPGEPYPDEDLQDFLRYKLSPKGTITAIKDPH